MRKSRCSKPTGGLDGKPSVMPMPSVFVVIVNYRTPELACDCLVSLASMVPSLRGGRVIVADNDSGDASVQTINTRIAARGWSAWAEVLPLPRNGGFAYGNNAAIRRALGLDPGLEWIVLLNPDTVARPGALAELLAFDGGPRVGIKGAGIENGQGVREASSHKFPSPLGELEASASMAMLSRWLGRYIVTPPQPDTAQPCEWVSGACMAIRRELLQQVGLLDEGYFLYFEEVDFCLRASQAGWSCWSVPTARIMHLEGAATGIRVARQRRPPYWFASRRRFFVKAYGVSGLVLADALWAIGRLSLVARRALGLGGRAGAPGEPASLARDLLWGDLRALFSGELIGLRAMNVEVS